MPRGPYPIKAQHVTDWLQERLSGLSAPAANLKLEAELNGFAWRTVLRGLTHLGATRRREGFATGSSVVWTLDPHALADRTRQEREAQVPAERPHAPKDWWRTNAGILQKGLDMEVYMHPGEGMNAYKLRLVAAIKERKETT